MLNSDKQRQLSKLKFLEKKLFHSRASGDYTSFIRGCGFDFLQLREYHDGDDIRFMNWNAYAKTGKLLIKETAPERDRAIIIVMDCSSSNRYSSQQTLKSELILELCWSLSWLATNNKDNLGFLAFNGTDLKFLPCSKNKQQFFTIFNTATEQMAHGGETYLYKPLEYLVQLKQSKSIIFFISDFISQDFAQTSRLWDILIKKHYIIPVFVSDTLEQTTAHIPSMLIECQDPETGEILTLETGQLFEEFLQERYKQQLDFFVKKQLKPININTSDDLISKLMRYFEKK